jgi:hypothetical protein
VGFVLVAGFLAAPALSETIAGVARNQTSGRMATGDEVILVSLDHARRESGRTRTDSHGTFAFDVKDTGKPYLIRVVHMGVIYDAPASAGHVVSIDVFDADSNLNGVTGTIEIIRAGTNGNLLHVSDMIEINNESSPPVTRAGEHTFEVYLPTQAKIDSVLAAGPGKTGVLISATPVAGKSGRYAVDFPLKPGATKFAFNYDMPYDGHAAFHPKHGYALQQLAVMLPPTMRFSSGSPTFQVLPGANNYRVEAATNVSAGDGPEFEISGAGAIPALQAQPHSPAKQRAAAVPTLTLDDPRSSGAQARGANAFGARASTPSTSLSPLQLWFLRAGAALVPAACGFLLWRRQRLPTNPMIAAAQKTKQIRPPSASLIEALKAELSQLEIDRLHGTISGEDYDSTKRALEETVRRALVRAGDG